MNNIPIYFLLLKHVCCTIDYWSEDFDVNKNCEKEDVIKEIMSRPVKDRNCAIKTKGTHEYYK